MKDKMIVISLCDLVEYVQRRERKAKIEVLGDIKPYGNGRRIQEMINKLKAGTNDKTDRKKKTLPKEYKVVIRNVSERYTGSEFADLDQFLVRKD